MILDWYWLLSIATIHYIADFFVQTHEQSLQKSTDIKQLSLHVLTYTVTFFPFIIVFLCCTKEYSVNDHTGLGLFWAALIITFVSHWIVDYFTSRVAKIFFDRKEIRQGFQIVGADQLFHYCTLYLTFDWLLNF
jgi:hypothetical protein